MVGGEEATRRIAAGAEAVVKGSQSVPATACELCVDWELTTAPPVAPRPRGWGYPQPPTGERCVGSP